MKPLLKQECRLAGMRPDAMRLGYRFSSRKLRMAALLLACSLLSPVFFGALSPTCSYAATWPVAGSQLSPSLGFRETYTAGTSNSYVHSGLDATASAGSQILSPIAGRVSFTGSVPSGDSLLTGGGTGQTMLAVSVKMSDGRTVTLMPFDDVWVEKGQVLEEGAVLGTLAASGDRSSSSPHVHMGLKKDGVYYDPMLLFGVDTGQQKRGVEEEESATAAALADAGANAAPAAEAVVQPGEGVAAAGASVAEGAMVPGGELLQQDSPLSGTDSAVQPATVAEGNVASSAHGSAAGAASAGLAAQGAVAGVPALQESEAFGTISSGSVRDARQLPATGTLPFLGVAAGAFVQLGQACEEQLSGLAAALYAVAESSGVPFATLVLASVFAAVASVAALLYAAGKAMPIVKNVWIEEIAPLFARIGGVTIHRLFPASGITFKSRSRIARGR